MKNSERVYAKTSKKYMETKKTLNYLFISCHSQILLSFDHNKRPYNKRLVNLKMPCKTHVPGLVLKTTLSPKNQDQT